MPSFQFTPRLQEAIDLAARIHAGQLRKDPEFATPYDAHLFGVALILLQHSFSEEVILAGLFHDVLEDQPESTTEIEAYGPEIVKLVQWLSEKKRDESGIKLPWTVRKAAYLEQLRHAPPEARAIACADKIHNMQSTLLVARRGHDPWALLKGDQDAQLAHWQELYTALADGWEHPILEHYLRTLKSLKCTS